MADSNPLFIGFDWAEDITFEDDDGSPFPVTGWSLAAEFREMNHSAVLLALDATKIAVTDGPGGVATVTLTADDTESLWPIVERYPGQVRFFDFIVWRVNGSALEFQASLKVKGIT